MLLGRGAEIAALNDLVDGAVRRRGDLLLLRGAWGVGKSALLAEAAAAAQARGLSVVTATAHEPEARVPFAGVYHLVAGAGSSLGEREVVLAAVGRGGQDDDHRSVARTLLEVLSRRPTLVTIDDSQWMDPATWAVLAGLRHDLAGRAAAVVLALGDDPPSAAGLPALTIKPLAAKPARQLLARVAPRLPLGARAAMLREARGNPMALIELAGLRERPDELSPRVRQRVAALTEDLPPATLAILRVAAFADSDDRDEIVAAAAALTTDPPGVDALLLAIERGLMIDGPGLMFGHPLLRRALRLATPPGVRLAIHAALAKVMTGARRTWHRAAAAARPDDDLARELAALGDDAYAQGDGETAARAARRAAELQASPAQRAGLLLTAAIRLAELGRRDEALPLLEQVDEEQLHGPERARLAWVREEYLGGWTGSARLVAVAAAADAMREQGNQLLAMETLQWAGARLAWSTADASARAALLAVADRIDLPPDDPRLLSLLARIAPFERGAAVLEHLAWPVAPAPPGDRYLLGLAAAAVGAFDIATGQLALAVEGLRRQGNRGLVMKALLSQAWSAAHLAETPLGSAAATECRRLAHAIGQPHWAATATVIGAQVAALRGDSGAAATLAARAERVLLPIGAHPALAAIPLVRAIDALGAGRPGEAFDALYRVFDPSDVRFGPLVRLYALGLLAEAAVQSGHQDELARVVTELEPLAATFPSPPLLRGLAYARAVLAPAEELFEAGLAAAPATWRFERARLQLAYGGWLRRHRRPAASRTHLREAATTFDALGVVPWAERARRELAATGESVRRGVEREHLTPQELQIAQLAARGLSNRQIAERLFLSPRTVTTHLYRIYPKIGVSSRTELARVLPPDG